MKEQELIQKSIDYASNLGCKIIRGYIFDWQNKDNPYKITEIPVACNAIGAILLYLGLHELVKDGFSPNWIDVLCKKTGLTRPWIWRFSHGWDRGNKLSFTYTENKKEITEYDEISKEGNRLALIYTTKERWKEDLPKRVTFIESLLSNNIEDMPTPLIESIDNV